MNAQGAAALADLVAALKRLIDALHEEQATLSESDVALLIGRLCQPGRPEA